MSDARDNDVVLPRDRPRVQSRRLRGEIGEDRVGIAGRDRDDALAIVRDDVQAETQTGATRDLADRLVEGIALDLREPHPGILEEAHSVRRRNHRLAGAADRDRLPTAGVARVLMRLDDTRRHDQVSVFHKLLREARDAVRRDRPEVGPHRGITSVGIDDAHAVDNRAELLALLSVRRRAVEPDRHDHGDLRVGDAAGVQFIEERRNQDRIGGGTRQVGHRDDCTCALGFAYGLRGELPKARSAKRRGEPPGGFLREIGDRRSRG